MFAFSINSQVGSGAEEPTRQKSARDMKDLEIEDSKPSVITPTPSVLCECCLNRMCLLQPRWCAYKAWEMLGPVTLTPHQSVQFSARKQLIKLPSSLTFFLDTSF
ncbi:hypothetical protein RRG08_003278 [Elysia crispata]|uniref:Uncharacterized protein n=1 Tax=Elysia crispata TaxID=231223 RepID=A0AAE0YLC3_9GAST|nr:hypothetical protein RRG08_003278 [Elysia crispata]